MTSGAPVTITLNREQAIVLDDCLARMFGENDLHDWDNVEFKFEDECEQWPFFTVRDSLAAQLATELAATNYDQLLEDARKSIIAHQWGE